MFLPHICLQCAVFITRNKTTYGDKSNTPSRIKTPKPNQSLRARTGQRNEGNWCVCFSWTLSCNQCLRLGEGHCEVHTAFLHMGGPITALRYGGANRSSSLHKRTNHSSATDILFMHVVKLILKIKRRSSLLNPSLRLLEKALCCLVGAFWAGGSTCIRWTTWNHGVSSSPPQRPTMDPQGSRLRPTMDPRGSLPAQPYWTWSLYHSLPTCADLVRCLLALTLS